MGENIIIHHHVVQHKVEIRTLVTLSLLLCSVQKMGYRAAAMDAIVIQGVLLPILRHCPRQTAFAN